METITIADAVVKRSGPRMTITGQNIDGRLKVSVDEIDFSAAPEGYAAQATNKVTGQIYLLI